MIHSFFPRFGQICVVKKDLGKTSVEQNSSQSFFFFGSIMFVEFFLIVFESIILGEFGPSCFAKCRAKEAHN